MPGGQRLAEMEQELEQLKRQLPRHSISPAMQARIDELEEEITILREQTEKGVHPQAHTDK